MVKDLQQLLQKKEKPVKVAYISTYIPRKCGIATYTKNLTSAINLLNPYALAQIVAMVRPEENFEYPWEVKYRIQEGTREDYARVAEELNASNVQVVLLEHEFGIFGGEYGSYILDFVDRLKKPLVSTFHTVLDDTESAASKIMRRIARKSEAIIVMMEQTAWKLSNVHKVPLKKIVAIPHGTLDLAYESTQKFKKKRHLENTFILGNINLLDWNKGIEYAIEGVAQVVKKYPNVVYFVLGQTHPGVIRNEGERYRNFLKSRVKKLGIEKNVRFINKYLSLTELIDWLKAIDVYVTPYLVPSQVASGGLAYAIGAGKACISTPYIYAKEVLRHGRGILFPYQNSHKIAEAVTELYENPQKKEAVQRAAYEYGRHMTWPNVADSHLDLLRTIVKNGYFTDQTPIAKEKL